MGNRGLPGQFEQIVLLSLWHAGEDATGATIHSEIESRGGQEVAITAVYVTLGRLEDKHMVSSRRARTGPVGSRAGGVRKVFRIEPPGIEALRRARRHLERFWRGIEADPVTRPGS